MNFRPTRHRPPVTSFVSMADIAFLTIIFLMLTASATQGPKIEVDLPEAGSGRPIEHPVAVTIAVSRDGGFAVDDQPVAPDALAAALRPRVAAMTRPVVILAADREVDFRYVVQAMDAARQAGVRELDISVREREP